ILVAGILSQVQVRRNKKGEAWASAWLEDRTGRRELLCFAEAYRRLEGQLRLTQPVLVRGRVMAEDEGEAKLQVMDINDLASAPLALPQSLRLRLALDQSDARNLGRLVEMLKTPSGSAKLHLHAFSERDQFEQILEITTGVAGGCAFRRDLENLCGPGSVRVLE